MLKIGACPYFLSLFSFLETRQSAIIMRKQSAAAMGSQSYVKSRLSQGFAEFEMRI